MAILQRVESYDFPNFEINLQENGMVLRVTFCENPLYFHSSLMCFHKFPKKIYHSQNFGDPTQGVLYLHNHRRSPGKLNYIVDNGQNDEFFI